MKNVKPSIAIQRQIPFHIRENYPLFVEFLKAYYEYLEQNQNIELETVRDIDTSLDQFIDQFRGEISNGIPIDIAQDKRMLIKHLREFYLSRGSEASYKFIFKSLFSKNAELYYPSAQILRVSDGKWNQDVSVFVQTTGTNLNLNALSGNFVTITNTKAVFGKTITKTLRTHVERVVQYSTGIFELFIERDYMNEVTVGSTVTYTGSNSSQYTGTILPCPAKITVEKGGKNFKVGQLFSLKTQLGRGCVVKVTKVGTDGAILKVNLITVGLDYETTFYSYLSSKELTASEYVIPAKLNTPFQSGDTGYIDNTSGFEDYGFLNRQTYFDYDDTIPIQDASYSGDRFFADSSYVGEIVSQFYADDTSTPIDPNIAVIRVDLGAVARYPGYYSSQDGFVSDEMFIQDGEYYQAFSYVLKVEEELRKYSNLVKKILHPAGLKIFSEYTITNVVSYKSIIRALKKLISKIDQVGSLDAIAMTVGKSFSSSAIASDGYSSLDLKNPFQIIGTSIISDSVVITDINANLYSKILTETIGVNETNFYIGLPLGDQQRFFELTFQSIDSLSNSYDKNVEDVVGAIDGFDSTSIEFDDYGLIADATIADILDCGSITDNNITQAIVCGDILVISSRSFDKVINDSINITSVGNIALNSYDAQHYFDVSDGYRSDTTLIT